MFKEVLLTAFEEDMIENITYKQWVTVDRCTFETITKSAEDFVQEFCKQLVHLKKHDFVAKQQSAFFSEKKSALEENAIIYSVTFLKISHLYFRMKHKAFIGITQWLQSIHV